MKPLSEEAHGSPSESERVERKTTDTFNKNLINKKVAQLRNRRQFKHAQYLLIKHCRRIMGFADEPIHFVDTPFFLTIEQVPFSLTGRPSSQQPKLKNP
ncbi:hypothetical protein E4665_11960 [Sporolactobacillus shoreae]|uniref:Uncharacterized protein n=1 Tax=Sporolactobacillus shoreae TaxID=1465501 RepID=A0A4Z0GKY4_9BACL|nr:hypothetical protein [Sporolactobacillus shoreae]TGA97549.1 hypothetical protein E4665_11960 [Sporolactobacillus shoreae]